MCGGLTESHDETRCFANRRTAGMFEMTHSFCSDVSGTEHPHAPSMARLIQIRARSLRVAVVCVFILVIFFAVAFVFLFIFFLVGLIPKKDIGLRRAIRRVRVEALWAYSDHVYMVLCARWQEHQVLACGRWHVD